MKYWKLITTTIILVVSGSLNAASVVYTDRILWENNTLNITNIDFEGYTVPFFYDTYPGSDSGVTFTSTSAIYVIGEDYTEDTGSFSLGTGDVIASSYGDGINAVLPSNITSIGVDLGSYGISTTTINIILESGELFTSTISSPSGGYSDPASGFWGITTDNPIESILFDSSYTNIIVDNFSFGSSAVPLPAAAWLFGSGLIALAGFARRKKA